MRRKEKIITYLPVMCGAMYFWVVSSFLDFVNMSFEDYRAIVVCIWTLLTCASSICMIKLVEKFDDNDSEED